MPPTNDFPLPLYLQLPPEIRDLPLKEDPDELSPDFLCFEAIYHAVANSAPRTSHIIDIGGFMGTQGWLFSKFAEYICVDSYDRTAPYTLGADRLPEPIGIQGTDAPRISDFMPRRTPLPKNGRHIAMDGNDFLDLLESGFLEDTVNKNDWFICSAVPNNQLQNRISRLPNHAVWYPGGTFDFSDHKCEESFRQLYTKDFQAHVTEQLTKHFDQKRKERMATIETVVPEATVQMLEYA